MNASSLPSGTLAAAVLKTLAEEVKTAVNGGKDGLLAEMSALKIKTLVAELPDGTEVATVTRAAGTAKPKVTDPGRFLAWVEQNRPGEIETVRSVRESYQKALLEAIAGTELVDPETGEKVPGVEWADSSPYLVITFAKDGPGGQELIKRAWRAGEISLDSLLALPAPEGDGDDT